MDFKIEHDRAGMGSFTQVQFGKGMENGYHEVTLVLANSYGAKDLDTRYVNGGISLSVKQFQRCTVHNSEDVSDSEGTIHDDWLLSVVFLQDLLMILAIWDETRLQRFCKAWKEVNNTTKFLKTVFEELSGLEKMEYKVC